MVEPWSRERDHGFFFPRGKAPDRSVPTFMTRGSAGWTSLLSAGRESRCTAISIFSYRNTEVDTRKGLGMGLAGRWIHRFLTASPPVLCILGAALCSFRAERIPCLSPAAPTCPSAVHRRFIGPPGHACCEAAENSEAIYRKLRTPGPRSAGAVPDITARHAATSTAADFLVCPPREISYSGFSPPLLI